MSVAFILADLGYDVWLGNARGNAYSKKHLYLDPEEEEFWDFSSVLLIIYILYLIYYIIFTIAFKLNNKKRNEKK